MWVSDSKRLWLFCDVLVYQLYFEWFYRDAHFFGFDCDGLFLSNLCWNSSACFNSSPTIYDSFFQAFVDSPGLPGGVQEEIMRREYQNFTEFYAFYLSQHQNKTCRLLHAYGTFFALLYSGAMLILWQWIWLLLAPVIGYFFAWMGHFFFEKNKPATFRYPLWSLMADFKMMKEIVWED